MRSTWWMAELVVIGLAIAAFCSEARTEEINTNVYPIDLPTTLRLAGAQSLDVQIARERLKEAQANRLSALEQFLPWISPGIGYHRRDGVAQAVPSGIISDAHFQSYSPGASLVAQVALGDAIYNSLAAKQLIVVSEQALETQKQDSILNAAQAYFDLARAQAIASVINEARQISQDYQQQLQAGVAAGVFFKGDELRVRSQTEHYQVEQRQALEQQRVAAATLARVLHLDARVELVPRESELVALHIVSHATPLDTLVERALHARPEIHQGKAGLSAARAAKKGAVYGPWIPSVGAQVFGGGLGGGPDSGPGNFGAEGDCTVGLSWRIGPGGLFDSARINANRARVATAELGMEKIKDAIIAEVVSSLARVQSLSAQIDMTRTNMATATEALELSHQRKQFGVGVVLEDIQTQKDLTSARSDYVKALADFNKAQYALARALGEL